MFEQEIANKLTADTGITTLIGLKVVIPTGAGPFLQVVSVRGMRPIKIHNTKKVALQRPEGMIICTAESWTVARTGCRQAYDSLVGIDGDGVYNTIIGGTFYLELNAEQEPFDM